MQISFVNLPFKTLQRLPIALGIKTKFLNKIELDLAPLLSPASSHALSGPLAASSPAKLSFSYLPL